MRSFNRNSGSQSRRHGGFRREDRQMFRVVCSNCGKDCEVPFKPTGTKPVYCSDCFEKMGGKNERRSFNRSRFGERTHQDNQYKAQFEAVNAKLDKILNLLQPEFISKSTTPLKIAVEKTPKKKLSEEKE